MHKDEKEAAGFPVAFLMGAEDVRLCVFAPAAGRHQDGLAGFEGGREVQDALVRAAAEAQQNVAFRSRYGPSTRTSACSSSRRTAGLRIFSSSSNR